MDPNFIYVVNIHDLGRGLVLVSCDDARGDIPF